MKNTNQTVPKWCSYAGGFLVCFFLERCVCNALPLWQAVPLLTPLAAAAVGFWEGAEAGALFGLGAGLLASAACGPGHARMIWMLSLIGWLCGQTVQRSLGRTLPGYLLCAAAAMAGVEAVQTALAFRGEHLEAVASIALREGGCSLLYAPGVGLLFSCLYRRFRPSLEWS